jgi:hypothetical protein
MTKDLIPGVEGNIPNERPADAPESILRAPLAPESTPEPRQEVALPALPANAHIVDRAAVRRQERTEVARILERAARRLEAPPRQPFGSEASSPARPNP